MHNNGIIHQCNLCPQLWCESNYCGNVPLTFQIDVRSRRKHRVMQFQSGKACIIHGLACKKAAAKHFRYTHLRLVLNAIILPLNQQPIATHKKSCRALLRKGKCESFGPKDSSDNDYDDKNYGRDYGELF